MQRTTSNKNAWAFEYYDENIFGGKIPDNVDVPLDVEIDRRLFTKAGFKRYERRKQETNPNKVVLLSSVNHESQEMIEEENLDAHDKSHHED